MLHEAELGDDQILRASRCVGQSQHTSWRLGRTDEQILESPELLPFRDAKEPGGVGQDVVVVLDPGSSHR
jgi:hypothetical protein